MMAKETQKEKITRLENDVKISHEIIKKLNNEILMMQDNADRNFNNSADYVQMKKYIKELELKLKVVQDSANHNRIMYENEIKKNDLLISEIKDLKDKQCNKTFNERGAGRKHKFSLQEEETIKMYRLQGKTIREIAEIFDCSTGLICNLVNKYM